MKFTKIVNRGTNEEVLKNYCNKEINMQKSRIKEGEQLFIQYVSGSFFKHEVVQTVVYESKTLITITTTNKIWTIGE